MDADGSNKKRTYTLIVAALVVALVIVAAQALGLPRFLKGLAIDPIATGGPAPEFEIASLAGETISLAQFEGKAVLLKFWSVS